MLAFALRNNPRAICLIKIISKWRGNASQKIDAIRKGLLRATHETENSIVISFFFPVGNPFMINSSFNVYSCNRELLDCYNTLIIVQVTVWILPPMCIKLKLVMVEGWTFSPTLKRASQRVFRFCADSSLCLHGKYYQNNEENGKRKR